MILSLLLAATVPKSIPDGFAGVWGAPDGQVLALLGSNPSQMRYNGFEYEVYDIGQVPTGENVGAWARVKALRVAGAQAPTPFAVSGPNPARPNSWEGDLFSNISVLESGDMRFSFGPARSDGVVTSIRVHFLNEAHQTKLLDTFWYKFGFDKVSFADSFSAPHYAASLKTSDGKSYSGSLTYNDKSYVIRGKRTGIRLGFEVWSREYNRLEGYGYADWTPSAKRLDKIESGEASSTDAIFVFLALPNVLPSGSSFEMHVK